VIHSGAIMPPKGRWEPQADAAPVRPEEDWIPISALQHYSYCPRQCALIHVEQVWADNTHTYRGRWSHERVDMERVRSSRGYPIVTALPVWSDRLGLQGKCDVVEWRDGVPYPVEFKTGSTRTRRWIHDEIQLAAQAICLEEMCGVPVTEGAVFHVASHRRRTVAITSELRETVRRLAAEIREMVETGRIPDPVNDARCRHCSLIEICRPQMPLKGGDWRAWVERELRREHAEEVSGTWG
jgi:CRISPR-associated exonuclease Cas4